MRRRGYTLVEVLVAAVIAGVIMTAVYQMFVAGARAYTRSEGRVGLQSAGLVTMAHMLADLRPSASALLTVQADATAPPVAFSCRVPSQNYFVVYYQNGTTLVRKVWPRWQGLAVAPQEPVKDTTPIAANVRLTVAQLRTLCASPNGTEQVLADSVQAMTLSTGSNSLTTGLELEKTVLSQKVDESVSTTVYFRNRVQ